MNDHNARPATLQENLAYLRAIAENGRLAARLSGEYLLLWGVLTAGAYLGQFAVTLAGGPYWLIGAGYFAMLAVGWAGSTALAARDRQKGGARPAGVRMYSTLFTCAGATVTVFAIGASLTPAMPYEAIFIVAALMIGMCFLTTGALSEERWLVMVGAGWLASATAGFALIGSLALPLFFAVVWLLLLAAPGLVLARRARAATPPGLDPSKPAADAV